MKISKLTSDDLDAVDQLMLPNTRTVGFLPREVLKEYLNKDCVLGVSTQDDTLIGYLLYGAYLDRFRVTQLCVSEGFRNKGVARKLIETLKKSTTTQKVIVLNCRNDFPAHSMWPKLGFVSVDEHRGRSKEGHLLTRWLLTLAPDDQLALFRANVSDTVLDAVIDAQIFFDFYKPDIDVTQPSKALISDSFVDSLNLWFTDELLNEIGRNQSDDERRADRERTGQFSQVQHNPRTVEALSETLKQILPSGTESQLSDINHLVKTAASDVDIFVTRDQGLLKKAVEIADLVNLEVLSPTALILRLNELSEEQPYEPNRVSGLGLRWQRLSSDELSTFPFDRFLDRGESLRSFRGAIDSFLVDSRPHELDVLRSEEDPVALRGLRYDLERGLTISLCRVAKKTSSDSALFGRFLIADAICKAMYKNLNMVKIEAASLTTGLVKGLWEMGFTRCGDYFIRFSFARYLDRKDVLSEIAELAPEAVDNYQSMTPLKLERSCSPLLSPVDQGYFLMPIRPGYALNLFDMQQSSHDLFGGTPGLLLRWSNVYYRKATYYKMLEAPGRILWYLSGDRKEVAYISHLDKVVIDTPKDLFRRFRKYGTFEWEDLYKMCRGDISKKLMALQFSHTFPLRRPIPLAEVWKAFDEDGVGRSVQSPRSIPCSTYRKLFQLGYPEQS